MQNDLIDLHTHSTCSDGSDAPGQLIRLAAQAGARAIALTDHDTIDGLAEARQAAAREGIEFINGIEVSAEYSPGTMHILGYYIDPQSETLAAQLEMLLNARDRRNPEIASRLQSLGVEIDYSEVEEIAGGEVVGRPHFARLLLQKGYVESIQNAFDRYLAKGAAAYVEKARLVPQDAIDLIHKAGGAAVLAHPYQLKCKSQEEADAVFDQLAALGLDGVEAVYSRHSPQDRERYASMATSRGMIVTGGSDYHGTYKPDIRLVTGKGDLSVSYSLLDGIKERARAAAISRRSGD
ncbi:MAG TPA: PHP domain-containing protein [Blastocatellia bacterium]|nr:PHP domain-containing protein [Blastocatellia bacterium]